jgi:hypothetical protein
MGLATEEGSMDDDVTERSRPRVGALVLAVVAVVAGLGVLGGPAGVGPTSPTPVTRLAEELSQELPTPPSAVRRVADAGAGTGATDLAAADGVAIAAEAPPASTSTTVAGAVPATTRPRSPVSTTTTPPRTVEQRGAAALALIRYPWERTGYSIVFTGPNDGLLGLTEPAQRRMTVYIRATQSIQEIARVLGHEIGHAVDFTMTSEAERAAYRQIRGLDDRAWYPNCSGCSDYNSPVGDWAETFAWWLQGNGTFASQLAAKPTAAQLTALTPLFTADATAVTTSTTGPRPTTTTTVRPYVSPPTRPTTPTTVTANPGTGSTPWWWSYYARQGRPSDGGSSGRGRR